MHAAKILSLVFVVNIVIYSDCDLEKVMQKQQKVKGGFYEKV
jgi:hypothetical protein